MKPLVLALVSLLFSLPAFAQLPGEAEKAKAAEQARKAADAPAAVPASDGPALDLWRWFIGPKAGKGAFKAGPMSCGQAHDLSNAAAKGKQRFINFEGHRYGMQWLISINSNKELCLGPQNDGRVIPAEALLPTPPGKGSEWLFADEKRGPAARALAGYIDAADKTMPIANFTLYRSTFWNQALKAILADDRARGLICQEVDFGPNCADVIVTKSPDDLYAAGRNAQLK